MWGIVGMKGKEKWRQNRISHCLRGSEGGEGIPRPKGKIGKPLGEQRIKRERGQVSPAHLDPQEPAEILGLISCPPRPPPATRVLREWEGGKGEQK